MLNPGLPIITAMDSAEIAIREEALYNGLVKYVRSEIGEYFTDEQLFKLCASLKKCRDRDNRLEKLTVRITSISEKKFLANRFFPNKFLRKDEMSAFLYDLAPYAFLSRRQMALVAKDMLPFFFASPETIYSTFTKLRGAPYTDTGNSVFLTLGNLPFHSTVKLEEMLLEIANSNS